MLISDFARSAGLSTDTVRYYVRLGLLRPEMSAKGGARPYQVFTDEHLLAARIIRRAQSLGMSLTEIKSLSDARRAGGMTRERSFSVLAEQLTKLEAKSAELNALMDYLRAKMDWLKCGQRGPGPVLATVEE
jgi:MerR family copper efflux transcriptional regulator